MSPFLQLRLTPLGLTLTRHGSQTTSNPHPTPAKNRRHLNIHLYTVMLRTTPPSNIKDVKAGKTGRSRARDQPFPLLCTATTAIDWALPLVFGFCEYVGGDTKLSSSHHGAFVFKIVLR
jgi:hypothetical protein